MENLFKQAIDQIVAARQGDTEGPIVFVLSKSEIEAITRNLDDYYVVNIQNGDEIVTNTEYTYLGHHIILTER